MAAGATITDVFKKKILLELDSDITTHGNYYIGIGRSNQWNSTEAVPTPAGHNFDVREAATSLQSIKVAEDRSFVVPRNTWTSGTKYDAFDDRLTDYPTNKYYVINSANNVYMCLESAKNANGVVQTSTVEPTSIILNKAFKNSDGYVWKFLYGLTTLNANKFLSANFIPVNFQKTASGDATLQQQKNIQDNAVAGQVSNIVLTSGGTGYSSTPTVTIEGNGVGATATATVISGIITKINLDSSSDSCRAFGQNYTKASVKITGGGGSGATARAVLAPKLGHGGDARDDLRSTQMMFNTKPNGTESGKFLVGQDFRQICLLRDPLANDNSTKFNSTSGLVLRSIKTNQSTISGLSKDNFIKGATSGAMAYVDHIDSSVIFFHQSDSSGFKPFTAGENIEKVASFAAGATTTALGPAASLAVSAQFGPQAQAEGGAGVMDVFPQSFDVFYIENRAPVVRDAAQTEDIKVVISI